MTRRSNGLRALVLIQVALSVVLTVGAGLLGRSLLNLVTNDHGFAADRLVAVDLYLRGTATDDPQQLFRTLVERASAVSGVSDVAVAMRLPTQTIGIRTQVRGPGSETTTATLRPIGVSYFNTTGIAIVQGRGFEVTDTATAPPVAVVNVTLAKQLSVERAVGVRLTSSFLESALTIVGVAGDTTPGGESDRPALYVPIDQSPIGGGYLIARATTDPAAIIPALTSQLRSAAPGLALDRMRRLSDDLAASRAITRFNTLLAGTFAGLALLLSTIGVYGLATGEVAARWREIALRLALGSHRDALWSVVRPCALVLTIGALVGTAAAAAVAPAIASLLHGVTPGDMPTLLAAPMMLAGVGLAAALLAAVRVLRADPASTLRGE